MSDAKFELPDWVTEHLNLYHSDPQAGHYWDASFAGGKGPTPCLLLTTTGRKSGAQREMPLIYGKHGNAHVVVASRGGTPTHPSWFLNLEANPAVKINVAGAESTGQARVATGTEREELWDMMVEIYPPYTDYQAKTERQIPVVVIDPA